MAAIAIPQYQNYIAKSQVSRVMSELGGIKTAVENCILEGKAANCELGATASNLLGTAVTNVPAGVAVDIDIANSTATITGTFSGSAASILQKANQNQLRWSRNEAGTWGCSTSVLEKFRPAGCSAALSTTPPPEEKK